MNNILIKIERRKEGKTMIDKHFIQNRITELRTKKNVSEYQMSLDLGCSKSYIQSISSGRTLPSMQKFLAICEYFDISPKDFFDEGIKYPFLINQINHNVSVLGENDLQILLPFIERLSKESNQR